MDKYLKMSDVFEGNVKCSHLGDDGVEEIKSGEDSGNFFTLEDDRYWIAQNRNHMECAAHAINSHDELVAEVERLRGALERIYGDGVNFIGAEDLEDEEDAAELQGKFNDSLIEVQSILGLK